METKVAMQFQFASHAVSIASMRSLSDFHESESSGNQLIQRVVRFLVCDHESVGISSIITDDGILFELEVAHEDFEAVIGAGGKTAEALRTILIALGKKLNLTFTLSISRKPRH